MERRATINQFDHHRWCWLGNKQYRPFSTANAVAQQDQCTSALCAMQTCDVLYPYFTLAESLSIYFLHPFKGPCRNKAL